MKKKISPKAAKAKARSLQDPVRDAFREVGKNLFHIEDADVLAAIMGQSGVDIRFSPVASKYFNFDIECKKRESMNVAGEFLKHAEKYKNTGHIPLFIHNKNHVKPMVTMYFSDFMQMFVAIPHAQVQADQPPTAGEPT